VSDASRAENLTIIVITAIMVFVILFIVLLSNHGELRAEELKLSVPVRIVCTEGEFVLCAPFVTEPVTLPDGQQVECGIAGHELFCTMTLSDELLL